MNRIFTRIGLGLSAVALAAGLGATYATAQDNNTNPQPPPFRMGGPGRGGPLGPMLRGLELTETQRTEVRALVEAAEAVIAQVHTRLRDDVMTLLTDEQKAQIAARPERPERGGRGFGGRGRPPGPAH
jgi:Spy/CpxP family protein refolding chaperone